MRAPLPFTALVQFIGERLSRYESRPVPSLPTSKATGNYGERVAAAFLRRHGYRVLFRNFLAQEGEIDLVCRSEDVLVFVEVRTRAGIKFGRPAESIDARKQAALRRAADEYLRLLDNPSIYHRFDAVEVNMQEGTIPSCALVTDILSEPLPPRFG